ncbi:MAG: GtrA family protein [Lachnospiraceae bacterium]|nr:GtrA family protein [Lachnospiraceae bacterium]
MKIKLPSFIKFAMSSGTSALIDLGVFSLMCFFLRDKGLGPVYLTIATVTARLISASFNYTVNYLLVFKSKETVLSTMPKYAINSVCIMCASSFLVSTIHPRLSNVLLFVAENELFVKIPVDITLFFINYLIQSRLIYKMDHRGRG